MQNWSMILFSIACVGCVVRGWVRISCVSCVSFSLAFSPLACLLCGFYYVRRSLSVILRWVNIALVVLCRPEVLLFRVLVRYEFEPFSGGADCVASLFSLVGLRGLWC